VKTGQFNVEVFGTTFNVTAYEKDTLQSIVLVQGVVKVHADHQEETLLMPNEMYSATPNTAPTVKPVNVTAYISWKTGLYQYESESLGTILKRLSRYYGQEIEYSPKVAQMKCSGKLDLKDDLQWVLKGISQTAPVRYVYLDGKYRVTNK
jgi:ferric-dicitrate binding protein FerR (iron transport regulator)